MNRNLYPIIGVLFMLPACIASDFEQNKEGKFVTKDKRGSFVIFEWKKVMQKDFSEEIKPLADILSKTFTGIELQRFKAYPKDVEPVIDFLAGDKTTFKKLVRNSVITMNAKTGAVEIVQENIFRKKMTELLKLYVLAADKSLPKDYKEFIFLNVKDQKTADLIGCAIFVIQENNNVYIWNMTLEPKSQGRGLGKLLASSIFKILPDTKKIDLGVYSTNKGAIGAYKHWGFVEEKKDSKTKDFRSIHMEYFADKSDILQKAAENLKTIK